MHGRGRFETRNVLEHEVEAYLRYPRGLIKLEEDHFPAIGGVPRVPSVECGECGEAVEDSSAPRDVFGSLADRPLQT